MTYVFTPPAVPAVPVQGRQARFPVNRIYCVGQNYRDHVREMGGDAAVNPKAGPPVFFSKPADAVVTDNSPVNYPPATTELHHEVELVVALGSGGAALDRQSAPGCIFGYAVGVDFTRRDLQAQAKNNGKPWDVAKGFDQSAPVSAIRPVSEGQTEDQLLADGGIWLAVNGETRQQADLADMIWSVPEIIAELSRFYELKAGDLIFTGTPAGVAAVVAGDRIRAGIDGVGELAFELLNPRT